MTTEDRVTKYFRAMDDETQIVAEEMFQILARDFPRASRLKIVVGRSVSATQVDAVALQTLGEGPNLVPVDLGKRPVVG